MSLRKYFWEAEIDLDIYTCTMYMYSTCRKVGSYYSFVERSFEVLVPYKCIYVLCIRKMKSVFQSQEATLWAWPDAMYTVAFSGTFWQKDLLIDGYISIYMYTYVDDILIL